eukprot:CAMPEP_0170192982 /NCGR_PEP_ID=MMETSP0040_2-20121228/55731_1 /TAXON_ID=641309 /ORGANISM="Lotharella oceanica, Strain CCMP622" /LENGTH=114 /DNA_ID=CAMNT_0010441483 /DNA_START=294 /DNA_END=638 /DNA_ORIENTATION=+
MAILHLRRNGSRSVPSAAMGSDAMGSDALGSDAVGSDAVDSDSTTDSRRTTLASGFLGPGGMASCVARIFLGSDCMGSEGFVGSEGTVDGDNQPPRSSRKNVTSSRSPPRERGR